MTFYQELQLNQAGSKNLLKKSETWLLYTSSSHLMTELAKIVLFSAEFMHTMNQKNWLVRH